MFVIGPSYYIVHFDEHDCVARVPRMSVLKLPRRSVGETCSIEWSDGVEYTATVLAMGKNLLFVTFSTWLFQIMSAFHTADSYISYIRKYTQQVM